MALTLGLNRKPLMKLGIFANLEKCISEETDKQPGSVRQTMDLQSKVVDLSVHKL